MPCLINNCMQNSACADIMSSPLEEINGSKILLNSNAINKISHFYPYNRNVAGLVYLKWEVINFAV